MSDLQSRIARALNLPGQRVAVGDGSIPGPVLGWNARDNLADMDPRFALSMDNYFPAGNLIKLRKGSADHVTGIVGPVEFLHEFAKGSTRKLIGFANGNSYDVTSPGVVGPALGMGFSSNRWFGCNAGSSGGERAIYTNGVDTPQAYDGTTWTVAGFSGPTGVLQGGTVNKKRFWAFEEKTGLAWYSPPEAVTGALAPFDIGSVVPSGGDLMAIGAITIDGGEGLDDLTVFVMRSGAIVLYSGTDPADAANWSIRGVWNAGNPIGQRCLVPFGNDLVFISDAGFVSLRQFTTAGINLEQSRLSDTIRNAVNEASIAFETNYGWGGIYNPHERQLLFNVPVIEGDVSNQYVMNSLTGAWARFRDWNTFTMGHLSHELYGGADGKVIKLNEGGVDSGNAITGSWQSAWNYFGQRGRNKHFKLYRPTLQTSGPIILSSAVGVDFTNPPGLASSGTTSPAAGQWNVSEWNTAQWATGLQTTADWRGAGVEGRTASVAYQTVTQGQEVEFLATDFLYEVGSQV